MTSSVIKSYSSVQWLPIPKDNDGMVHYLMMQWLLDTKTSLWKGQKSIPGATPPTRRATLPLKFGPELKYCIEKKFCIHRKHQGRDHLHSFNTTLLRRYSTLCTTPQTTITLCIKGQMTACFFSRASKSSECFTAPKHNNKPKQFSEVVLGKSHVFTCLTIRVHSFWSMWINCSQFVIANGDKSVFQMPACCWIACELSASPELLLVLRPNPHLHHYVQLHSGSIQLFL